MDNSIILYLLGSSFVAFCIGYYFGVNRGVLISKSIESIRIQTSVVHCDGIQVGIEIERNRPNYFKVGNSQKDLAKDLSSLVTIKKEHFMELTNYAKNKNR